MNTFSNFWLYLNSDYMNSNQTTAFSCRFSYIILQKSADHSRSTLRKQRQALAWFGFWSSARPLTVIDICQLISSKVLVLLHTLRLNLTLSSHIVFCYTGYVSTSYWAPILCFATHVTFQPHTELPYCVLLHTLRVNLILSSHIVFCYTRYLSTSYWAPISCFCDCFSYV